MEADRPQEGGSEEVEGVSGWKVNQEMDRSHPRGICVPGAVLTGQWGAMTRLDYLLPYGLFKTADF